MHKPFHFSIELGQHKPTLSSNTTKSSLSWVSPLTLISSLSCIYSSLLRWTNQDHNPSDDEQFSSGISSTIEQFCIDDGSMFIFS
jgi:hypothetical protein